MAVMNLGRMARLGVLGGQRLPIAQLLCRRLAQAEIHTGALCGPWRVRSAYAPAVQSQWPAQGLCGPPQALQTCRGLQGSAPDVVHMQIVENCTADPPPLLQLGTQTLALMKQRKEGNPWGSCCPIYFAFDLEATGLSTEMSEVLQMAVVPMDPESSSVFQCYVEWSGSITQEVVDLLQMDVDDHKRQAIPFRQALVAMLEYVAGMVLERGAVYGTPCFPVLVAHNGTSYDWPLLATTVLRNDISAEVFEDAGIHFFDSLRLIRQMRRANQELNDSLPVSNSLASLYGHLVAKDKTDFHNALVDAKALRDVWNMLGLKGDGRQEGRQISTASFMDVLDNIHKNRNKAAATKAQWAAEIMRLRGAAYSVDKVSQQRPTTVSTTGGLSNTVESMATAVHNQRTAKAINGSQQAAKKTGTRGKRGHMGSQDGLAVMVAKLRSVVTELKLSLRENN